jgi:hypothetical protein
VPANEHSYGRPQLAASSTSTPMTKHTNCGRHGRPTMKPRMMSLLILSVFLHVPWIKCDLLLHELFRSSSSSSLFQNTLIHCPGMHRGARAVPGPKG